jgi:peptide-methionine (R)-S-oxide reductase
MRFAAFCFAAALLCLACVAGSCGPDERAGSAPKGAGRVARTDAEWRKLLTPEQYRVLRRKDTERPFTGKYWNTTESGVYCCAGCGQELFRSTAKFDAGCGWPSFWEAIDPSRVELRDDRSLGMHRIEVLCKRCGGHLGHLFDDGPKPTGLRFCINSASLTFRKAPPKKP